jgi:hypothetical protein
MARMKAAESVIGHMVVYGLFELCEDWRRGAGAGG